MTNEEASRILHCPDAYVTDEDSEFAHTVSMFSKAYGKALAVAFKALEQEPCEDCIRRRDALDALHMCLATNSYNEDVTGDSYICYEEAEYEIENLQSVQLKTKTGHWIKSTNDYNATSYMCSECGHWHPLHNHSLGFRYCNWCGVKMVEPQESEDKI